MQASVEQKINHFSEFDNKRTHLQFSSPSDLVVNKNIKYDFNIAIHQTKDAERTELETFIRDGFKKSYGADISVSMPTLVAIKNSSFKAALGIRTGDQPMFIEQYLDEAIEQCLSKQGISVERGNIVEIGHLYSNKPEFVLPLLLTTGVSLFLNSYRYIAFCATSQVSELVQKSGIKLLDLKEADKDKLVSSNDNWGSYYDTQPRVVAISTLDIIDAITKKPRYLAMSGALSAEIRGASVKLGGSRL